MRIFSTSARFMDGAHLESRFTRQHDESAPRHGRMPTGGADSAPLARAEMAAEPAACLPSALTLASALPQQPRRILVADDDPLVRGSVVAVLESEGFWAAEAADGRETIRRAISDKPDLILLDLNMPGWNGWTTFSQLDRVVPLIPVIVITARPNEYEKAAKLRVDAFMEKPLDFPLLLGAIRLLISSEEARLMRRARHRPFETKLLRTIRQEVEGSDFSPPCMPD